MPRFHAPAPHHRLHAAHGAWTASWARLAMLSTKSITVRVPASAAKRSFVSAGSFEQFGCPRQRFLLQAAKAANRRLRWLGGQSGSGSSAICHGHVYGAKEPSQRKTQEITLCCSENGALTCEKELVAGSLSVRISVWPQASDSDSVSTASWLSRHVANGRSAGAEVASSSSSGSGSTGSRDLGAVTHER